MIGRPWYSWFLGGRELGFSRAKISAELKMDSSFAASDI
jgi:hypothetical protein